MRKKAIFLDLDGTVVDHGDVIYDSARKAIHLANQNGHQLFICTGRERSFISQKIFDLGITQGVFAAGASVHCDGKDIYKVSFTNEQYQKIVKSLLKHNACFAIESEEGELIPDGIFERDMQAQEALVAIGAKVIDKIPQNADNIDKFIYILADCDRAVIIKELDGICDIIASSYLEDDRGGEVMQVGITKETGIRKILDYYGISHEDTICIGDSNNDFEMIKYCNLGIAMGNACENLKEVADYVTTDIKQDGLYNAFVYAGVI